jgi:hypothetical protein
MIGLLMGALVPDYYRAVFRESDNRAFEPVQVGIGLGLTQGLAVGLVVGMVVVVAGAISSHRLKKAAHD